VKGKYGQRTPDKIVKVKSSGVRKKEKDVNRGTNN